jgi:hypothetical protein
LSFSDPLWLLNRVQESRNRLEVEIRKFLHEISRVAVEALAHAREARAAGAAAVESALARLDRLEGGSIVGVTGLYL